VAFHFPEVSALFVGDAMTTRHVLTGVDGPQPAPFTLDPEGALQSLDRLESVQANWLIPGHGPPWTGGVAEAVRQVRERGRL
jgi:glyoxylase-like metal-dependent hydrolase (beta-lactamase superfamily II)